MAIRYSRHLPIVVFISDLVLINVALVIANYFVFHTYHFQNQSALFVVIVDISWICMSFLNKNFGTQRPLFFKDIFDRLLFSLSYHLLLVFGIIYFFKIPNVSRMEVAVGYLLFALFITMARVVLLLSIEFYRRMGYNQRHILIIGDKQISSRLNKSFARHPEYGYDITQILAGEELNDSLISRLENSVTAKQPDEIFICYKRINTDLLDHIITFGHENGILIKIVSDVTLIGNNAKLINYNQIPVLDLTPDMEISRKIKLLKRGFDVGFSLGTMTLGLPVFVMLYVITKVSSRGPAFYKQERIGRDEKPFYIYKFRSMYTNAEAMGAATFINQ